MNGARVMAVRTLLCLVAWSERRAQMFGRRP